MVKTCLLTFEAFPERVVLEGFDGEVMGRLGILMARFSDVGVGEAAYRVVAGGAVRGLRPAAGAAARQRRPWFRHVCRDGEDIVMMPRGRVRLGPGRAEALVEWTDAGPTVDGYVGTTLLETALIHALAKDGFVVNHAAALEFGGMGLLVVGSSRAGKSTLCAAALAAGGAIVSDDSVILGLDDDGVPAAGALRRDVWLRDGSVGLLPEAMRDRLWEGTSFGERRWRLEREAFPKFFRIRVRPQVIVLLRRDLRYREFVLRRVSSAAGFAGLIMASSPLFLSARYPLERERCMSVLLELVNGAPCFEVRMGKAMVKDPIATVRRLVEELSS